MIMEYRSPFQKNLLKSVLTLGAAGFFFFFFMFPAAGQPVPAKVENIPHLVTFGNKAETSWGDDDYCNIFFFIVPKSYHDPFYIRVYDPDTGGEIDELDGVFDTRTEFSVYGGEGCWTDDIDPSGTFRNGNMLASKTFDGSSQYDAKWYTFGPFNPTEGEFAEEFQGYIFKIIVLGVDGDDGNLYNFYLSTSPDQNLPIEGGDAFTYEYGFRLWNDTVNISHIYPYVDNRVVSIKQTNFDWDSDGEIRTVTVARLYQLNKVSGEDEWAESEFKIVDKEKNTSFDFQFIKKKDPMVRNNNVVISVRNQYGELLPFHTVPIGGVPKFQYGAAAKPIRKKR